MIIHKQVNGDMSKHGITYWKSKLGTNYVKNEVEVNHKANLAYLDKLRKLPENRVCADCGIGTTIWASVNLGVFLCLRCASLHRGVGTHISIPKGCSGTYLWGADELQQMERLGNAHAAEIYGGSDICPPQDASDAVWKQFIVDKYAFRKYASQSKPRKEKNLVPSYSTPKQLKMGGLPKLQKPPKQTTSIPCTSNEKVPVEDLLNIENTHSNNHIPSVFQSSTIEKQKDFFAQFGL